MVSRPKLTCSHWLASFLSAHQAPTLPLLGTVLRRDFWGEWLTSYDVDADNALSCKWPLSIPRGRKQLQPAKRGHWDTSVKFWESKWPNRRDTGLQFKTVRLESPTIFAWRSETGQYTYVWGERGPLAFLSIIGTSLRRLLQNHARNHEHEWHKSLLKCYCDPKNQFYFLLCISKLCNWTTKWPKF